MVVKIENNLIEILNHIYGIDYADNVRYKISTVRLNRLLTELCIDLNKVIFSSCDDEISGATWIIAADKYYDDNEVRNLVTYIIENNLYKEYFLDR